MDAEEAQQHIETEEVKQSWYQTVWSYLSIITVEPIIMCHCFAMTGPYVSAFLQDRVCVVNLGYEGDICNALDSDDNEHYMNQVQVHTSRIYMYKNTLEKILSLLCLLVIGPLSDRIGRKIPLLICEFGVFVQYVVYAIMYFIPSIPAEFSLVAVSLYGATGGAAGLFAFTSGYIVDVSTIKDRTMRITLLYACARVSTVSGNYIGGQIYLHYDYGVLFAVFAGVIVPGIIYGVFFVKTIVPKSMTKKIETESKKTEIESNSSDKPTHKCITFLDLNSLLDTIRVTFKKREGNTRTKILVLICAICAPVTAWSGEGMLDFLYVELKFGWDAIQYSYYQIMTYCVGIFSGTVGIYVLTKVFKIRDSFIGMGSAVLDIAAEIIRAFSWSSWVMYFQGVIMSLGGITLVIIRSCISKLVSPQEIGTVFAFLGIAEALVPLPANPIYTLVYNYNIDTFPGVIFLISAGLYCICFGAFFWIYYVTRNDKPTDENITEIADTQEVNKDKLKDYS